MFSSEKKAAEDRHRYLKAMPKKKMIIGNYAAEHGVVNAIRCYKKIFYSRFRLTINT